MAILEPYGFKETHTDDWVGIKLIHTTIFFPSLTLLVDLDHCAALNAPLQQKMLFLLRPQTFHVFCHNWWPLH